MAETGARRGIAGPGIPGSGFAFTLTTGPIDTPMFTARLKCLISNTV